MSSIPYTQHTRLSDSLERDFMREASSNDRALSLGSTAKHTFAMVKRAAGHCSSYMFDLTDALNQARAKDARFSRGYW